MDSTVEIENKYLDTKLQGNNSFAGFDMKKIIKGLVRRTGFDIVRYRPNPEPVKIKDLTDRENKIIQSVRPYTMTGPERIATLINAVTYVAQRKIPGDIAECAVWRGGSMMA